MMPCLTSGLYCVEWAKFCERLGVVPASRRSSATRDFFMHEVRSEFASAASTRRPAPGVCETARRCAHVHMAAKSAPQLDIYKNTITFSSYMIAATFSVFWLREWTRRMSVLRPRYQNTQPVKVPLQRVLVPAPNFAIVLCPTTMPLMAAAES